MCGPNSGERIHASFFSFLNFTLKVTTGDPALSRLICDYHSSDIRMKACRVLERADINITLRKVSRLPPVPGSFRKIGQLPAGDSRLQYFKDGAEQIYVLDGYAHMLARAEEGKFDICFKNMKYSGSFIKNALILFFKSRGLFALHSALVSRANTGILLSGDNGCGKTTLAKGLSRMGFSFECDDLGLVGVRAGKAVAVGLSGNMRERSIVRAGDASRAAKLCLPGWIFFLRLSRSKKTRISPLGKAETLSRLMEQSLLTCFEEPGQLERHIRMLKKLATQCASFQLSASSDRLEVCRSLERFLAK